MGRAFEISQGGQRKTLGCSSAFSKIGKSNYSTAKAGVPDPEMNAALRTAIRNPKAQNMPKTNIEAAIKRASGKDTESFIEELYEGKGPYGVMILAECLTDNHCPYSCQYENGYTINGAPPCSLGSMVNILPESCN